ncbi:cysteine synthase A [Clostridia bacterium]|nr:cysteine synthase A [Clostridia bacterium]
MRVENAIQLIGNTPVVRLRKMVEDNGPKIYVKLEKFNLGGSVKDRAVLGMLSQAREQGKINEKSVIVEATSGNTGIALALTGNLLGFSVIIVMPETMSRERQDIIRSYGAKLVLTAGPLGMKGAIEKAHELVSENEHALSLDQFENPGNVRAHETTTAKEILEDVPELDMFIAGIGTGGTLTGVAKQLKIHKPEVEIIGVEPLASSVLKGESPGPHKIQGIGAGFVPEILERDLIDELVSISDDVAYEVTRRLAAEEGLFLGISSGAAVAAALIKAKTLPETKTIVVIAPDGGEKYISTKVFGGN